jgi:fructose-1,6-bisphosphatase/inositol monophosphatase family enzyme
MDANELREAHELAARLVGEAAALVRERVRGEVAFHRKADRTLVSEVDLAVEALLRAGIAARFPADGILGEEEGETRPGAARRWVLDPIDGTRSLRHGIPLYGVLLALEEGGEPVAAAAALPALGRLYTAARGLGAWRDGEPLRQAPAVPEGVGEEVVALGERRQFPPGPALRLFDRLVAEHPGARIYPDCFGHLLAAEGSVGAMVDFGLRRWDLAATRLVVEEAGGVCRELDRRDVDGAERYDVVLGKPPVVEWVAARWAEAAAAPT